MNKKIILFLLLGIVGINTTFAAETKKQNYPQTSNVISQASLISETIEEVPMSQWITCENLDYHIDAISQILKKTKIKESNNQSNIKNIFIKILKKYLNNALQCNNEIKPVLVEEEVKCVFNNLISVYKTSDTIDIAPPYRQRNKCYAENSYWKRYCEWENSCTVKVMGQYWEQIQWKSSCGSKAYTTINWNNKRIDLNCNSTHPIDPEPIQPCMIIDCAQWYYHQYYGTDTNNCPIYKCENQNPSEQSYRWVIYQCKNWEETKLRNITSCKTYSTRKKYVNQYCSWSIVSFETIDQCKTYK